MLSFTFKIDKLLRAAATWVVPKAGFFDIYQENRKNENLTSTEQQSRLRIHDSANVHQDIMFCQWDVTAKEIKSSL